MNSKTSTSLPNRSFIEANNTPQNLPNHTVSTPPAAPTAQPAQSSNTTRQPIRPLNLPHPPPASPPKIRFIFQLASDMSLRGIKSWPECNTIQTVFKHAKALAVIFQDAFFLRLKYRGLERVIYEGKNAAVLRFVHEVVQMWTEKPAQVQDDMVDILVLRRFNKLDRETIYRPI